MTLGRVSVCLDNVAAPSAAADYPHPPDRAREQVRAWLAEPAAAGSIANATWEFVRADATTLVIMWDRGHAVEFTLPAVAAPF